jgi:hypothetical protein
VKAPSVSAMFKPNIVNNPAVAIVAQMVTKLFESRSWWVIERTLS